MRSAHCLHILRINEQVRPLTWRNQMVDSIGYALTLLPVYDTLAYRVQAQEPFAELLPSWVQVHAPHGVILFGFVFPLLCLLPVLFTVAAFFDECRTTGPTTRPKRFESHVGVQLKTLLCRFLSSQCSPFGSKIAKSPAAQSSSLSTPIILVLADARMVSFCPVVLAMT